MNKNILIIIVLVVFGLFSCEEIVDAPGIPYEEQLVIRAVLEAEQPINNILISRTLHPLEEYSQEKAAVIDADGYIMVDEKKYPLLYIGGGFRVSNLIPESGKKYILDIKWKNHHVTASTYIPKAIEIDSLYYETQKHEYDWGWYEIEFIIYAVFQPFTSSVYSGASIFDSFKQYSDYVLRTQDTLKSGKISLPVYESSHSDTNEFMYQINYFRASVEAYDTPFYNYFLTRYDGDSDNDIFGTAGTNIRGNINGGIGLFIGMASTEKKIEF
ncbi:DUF4249 family protein [Bacteroidota bacterium]